MLQQGFFKRFSKTKTCHIDFGSIQEITLTDCKVIKKNKSLYVFGDSYDQKKLKRNLYIVLLLQIILLIMWIFNQ